jgi:hypothetical protein
MSKPKHKGGGDAMAVAKHALAVAQSARKAPEKKYYYNALGTTNFLAGTVTQLFAVSQGVAANQRVGDALRCQRLRLRAKLYSLVPSNTTFRMALVRVLGAGTPAVTDIWVSDTTYSQRNRSLDDIYHVIKEETITLNDSFVAGDCAAILDWDMGLGGTPLHFTAGATTYERGGYFLVTTNDLADAASPGTKPAIGDTGTIWTAELTYTDA